MPKMDKRGELVEKHRLTPEQVRFQKKVGSLQEIRQMLEQKTLGLRAEFDKTRELWDLLGEGFMRLEKPKKNLFELQGMDFGEEEGAGQEEGGAAPPVEQNVPEWQMRY